MNGKVRLGISLAKPIVRRLNNHQESYAPQYGGLLCAYGVAQGYTPEIDPHAFPSA